MLLREAVVVWNVSENRICYLKYRDIVFMKSVRNLSLDKFNPDYKEE